MPDIPIFFRIMFGVSGVAAGVLLVFLGNIFDGNVLLMVVGVVLGVSSVGFLLGKRWGKFFTLSFIVCFIVVILLALALGGLANGIL